MAPLDPTESRVPQAPASDSGGRLNAGAPTDPAPFGKYYLLGLIARGGMAEVYRARPRPEAKQILAIKCMRPQLAREARFVDMFVREGKLALLLRHPSIVSTIDVGKIEGRYFIAMDYIGGKDLTQVLRRCQETNQRIPVPHAVHIAAKIAEGLHYAHTLAGEDGRPLNIVNRDVSPSNVRLSYNGEVKLLDFGIAQALMKFTSEIGVLKGKFSYMSPEQIRGMPVDARTDIFSTGIILHEMLTTEKLFRGDTEFALMEKVRKADVPPPSKFNRRVPPELDAICLKALTRDLGDRYPTGQALAADLTHLLTNYRFNSSELQDFVRSLFRADYQKEEVDLQASRTSLGPDERPPGPMGGPPIPSAVASEPSAPEVLLADDLTSPVDSPAAAAPPVASPQAPPEEEKRGGIWSKIRAKFTK
ncbi:MAG: serine/threonine protein kinase [Deltaproteobacteria bacterium]|nr:serine/threonine protein kinase [Deltaproteobacteria bacterium]